MVKALINVQWINVGVPENPEWKLRVYPIVSTLPEPGEMPMLGSFVIASDEAYKKAFEYRRDDCNDAIEEALLFSTGTNEERLVLHNLGVWEDPEECMEWNFMLIHKDPATTDLIAAKNDERYMFIDALEIADEDPAIDLYILEQLKAFEAKGLQ